MLKRCFFLLFLFTSSSTFGQNSKVGIWNMAAIILPGDSIHRWGACAELQNRTNNGFKQLQYFEVKGGITYYIDKSFTALVGTGRYDTYDFLAPPKSPTIKENRLYEQITSNQFLYRLKIEHRYRAEQRWINGLYRNRFRYRLNLFVPLNNTKIEAKTLFVSAADELFLNNKVPNFERNRVFAGLGYQLDRSWIVQSGWLNQYNYSLSGTNDKNYAILMFIYRMHRKNGLPREYMPSMTD
ncbi:DUF2490 domain-containing protein [Mucilaginibacter ginsenosidivorax]|uniref:DUF2490 domain-containing protein n=1 Tax=Mucilaginibacter ginsenosidivorax TaxID=862126 RepID=A0A5B8W533_9SPHI|nr:DUF2490 domain-containing protein [Mucilaginibacter ginsenosidivorax]QEC78537.1 DUF2490 domain-containing protein [Mucilaginibacter ginsenosidivorax]